MHISPGVLGEPSLLLDPCDGASHIPGKVPIIPHRDGGLVQLSISGVVKKRVETREVEFANQFIRRLS
jgi:hypothetical protein